MTTLNQVKADQLQARKDKQSIKATLLTTFIGEVQTKLTAFPTEARDAKEAETIQKVLTSFLKQNADAQKVVTDPQSLQTLKDEAEILKVYQPARMSEQELSEAINARFPDALQANQVGPAVGKLKKEFGDKMDAAMAKKLLDAKVQ